ncbi:enoyl-CoA delta isomerase 1, mitochondrial-like [Rhynchophorus ferrugineus]|uniref:enoyl-CoA delta isomerase 1, mitochondrial-like n=1 Tax=Rhynchophorus ferrugineus TaxID=354439 RepID=UPI003FCC5C74
MAFRSLTKTIAFSRFSRSFSAASNLVRVEVSDKSGIATVTLQRAPVNSLNLEILADFKQSLKELEKNKCRGAILTSAFKTFSAGLDINEMYKPEIDRAKKWWTTLQDVYELLYGSSYPTVAFINGAAPAGGCLLSMCCEYRVMVPNSIIGLNETQLGIVAPAWFANTMENIIGKRQTELALTTGRLFSTEEAFKIGLIDEIVQGKEDGINRANAFFSKFSKISPFARNLSKQIVRGDTLKKMSKNRENDLNLFLQTISQDSVQKGLGFYIESLKKKQAT